VIGDAIGRAGWLRALCFLAVAVALVANAVELIVDPNGAAWTAVRLLFSAGFVVALLVLAFSWGD
jgi:hypothetical protein